MQGSRELKPGSQLAGYRILELVGRGGTGLVYEAEHVVLGRRAALKTLVPDLVDDAEFRERLTRESRMVAGLDHPAVIPIYDAGESDGILYVAMRFVRGGDLSDLLSHERRLDVETTAGVLEQVAGALDTAHANGLVHRDVKPANVLLEEATSRVYLSDFGIAKHTDSAGLTKTGFFLGTVDSAAPEQIQGQAVGPPADVYAFGCMLYECLTGHPPFERSTVAATLRAHLLEPPPPLPQDLRLPEALDAIVARVLAKGEAERYPTCGTVVADLRDVLGVGRRTRAWTALRPVPSVRAEQAAALPATTKPLFGREQELERLDAWLRRPETRLVSLVGLAGTGKTRLALAAARSSADEFDTVAFVDLSNVGEPDRFLRVVGGALHLEVPDGASDLQALSARLAARTLLVLDGFERVLEAASSLAGLLEVAPRAVALVTSQMSLRLREEQRLPVGPLPVADPAHLHDLERLSRSPAVALFVDQALAVRPDFELTPENGAAVGRICMRLDGLPLAIELAAARVDLLTPQAILDRLHHRLDFLTEGGHGLPERHQTLRRAIDGTYELLTADERTLFARLGVFGGSWTLDAAEAVCRDPGQSGGGGELLKSLASLVDTGLVRQAAAAEDEPRFLLLGTIREYALERLAERGELDELRRRHAWRYLELSEAAEPELTGAGQLAWITWLGREEEDVWEALDWAVHDGGDLETGLRIASALARYWCMVGPAAVRRWLEEALTGAADVPEAVVGKASFAAGCTALSHGGFGQALQYFERSAEVARSRGDTGGEGAALAQAARAHLATGEPADARTAAEQALALADAGGDKATASAACGVLAELAADGGDEAGAEELFERASRLRRELGDRSLLAALFVDRARRDLGRREHAETAALLHEGLDLARQVRDSGVEALALCALGVLAARTGNPAEARRHLARALEIADRRGDRPTVAESVHGIAAVTAAQDPHRAARLLGAAQALRAAVGVERSPVERAPDELLRSSLCALGAVLDVEQTAGAVLPLDDVVRMALAAASQDDAPTEADDQPEGAAGAGSRRP